MLRERRTEKQLSMLSGSMGATWELETRHKNGTARQLYCCIQLINGDMILMKKRREQTFTRTHFAQYHKLRK